MIKFQQLMSYKQSRLGDERGVALIVYLFVLATMSALAVAAMQMTNLELLTSESYRKGQRAFYSAEVGLDLAVNAIVERFEDMVPYTESLDDPNADADGFVTVENYRDYKVRYKVTNPLKRFLYQSSVGSSFIFHYAHTYDIEATAISLKDSSKEFLKERIRILETPLVQYFLFYGQTGGGADLELFPGPEMNIWGRIHSNGNIYIGSSGDEKGGFSTINLRNYDDQGNLSPHLLSASGKITTRFKHSGEIFNNTVLVKTSNEGTTFSPIEALPPVIDKSNESEQEPRFNDYVLVNEPQFVTPSRSLIERGGFYEGRAKNPETNKIDSIIITGTGGLGPGSIEVSVSRPTLTNVTHLIQTGRTTSGNSVPGLPFPIIQETLNAFEDCREDDRSVDTTDIDINALQRWYVAYLASLGLSLGGDGILIYTSRSPDPSFTNQYGSLQAIRLVRIDRFRSIPELLDETTLATDNPLYVQGDFNSTNTKGVALVSDAFNILSNEFINHYPGWGSIPPNGGKVCGYDACVLYKYFRGSETTVNAAVFTGNVHEITIDGDGAHVFPRFHEWWHVKPKIPIPLGRSCRRHPFDREYDFTPTVLNILGSFVNLWTSKQAISPYQRAGKDNYSAPKRNWGWDVRFQDPNFWPPFIPSVFSVERVGFLEK